MSRLTNKEKEQIIQLYQDGITPLEIANQFNIHNGSVIRMVRKAGVARNQAATRVSPEQTQYIMSEYLKGISSEKIAEELKINGTTVCRVLTRNQIPIRPGHINKRKYNLNENYFRTIDLEEKAYILGFLYSDGNISKKGADISIRLKSIDLDILQKISNIIYQQDLTYISNNGKTEICGLRFCSKIMKQDLINLGCTPAKTFTIRFPIQQIPIPLVRHFIRGYFDGDGCVSIRKSGSYIVDITSNLLFIQDLVSIIKEQIGIDLRIAINKKNNLIGNFQSRNLADAKLFLEWIYQDSSIYLDRKYQKYLIIKNK